jgi:hypothetical protein
MKALKNHPQLKDGILNGTLSMSSIAKVQTFLDQLEKSEKKQSTQPEVNNAKKDLAPAIDQIDNKPQLDQKVTADIFGLISGKSAREAESILADLKPKLQGASEETPKMTEKEKALSQGFKQFNFVADSELVGLLDRLKEVTSHKNADPSLVELLKLACKLALSKIDPLEKAKRAEARKEKKPQLDVKKSGFTENQNQVRKVPAALSNQVWARDQGSCQQIRPDTGKRCGSKIQVQIHHLNPYAQGGEHSLQNLSLRCWPCNQRAAIVDYGPNHMKKFILKE